MTRLKKGDNLLSCEGDLQSEAAVKRLQTEILARIKAGVSNLILDMAGVSAISAFGIQVLLGTANTLRAMEESLTLQNVSKSVMTLFHRLSITGQFSIESESQAGGQT
ncbi:MAG TPA: anti-sigma factor antagonist [Candidatus Marinimicrobia bacterium]|nr:anti-sigma factor antagonist [Candidatus Neomarinimicrobiota bacterium]